MHDDDDAVSFLFQWIYDCDYKGNSNSNSRSSSNDDTSNETMTQLLYGVNSLNQCGEACFNRSSSGSSKCNFFTFKTPAICSLMKVTDVRQAAAQVTTAAGSICGFFPNRIGISIDIRHHPNKSLNSNSTTTTVVLMSSPLLSMRQWQTSSDASYKWAPACHFHKDKNLKVVFPSSPVPNLVACAQLCQAHFNCNYFDFEKNNGEQCFLKRAVGLFTEVNWTATNISCGFMPARIFNVELLRLAATTFTTTATAATVETRPDDDAAAATDEDFYILE